MAWAATQNNLGNALWTLGGQKKDAPLICEALEKQLLAWKVLAVGSPYTAKKAADSAKSTVATLKNAFNLSMYNTCVAKHLEALKQYRITLSFGGVTGIPAKKERATQKAPFGVMGQAGAADTDREISLADESWSAAEAHYLRFAHF